MLIIKMIVIRVIAMIPCGFGFQLSTVWFGVLTYLKKEGNGRWSVDRLIGRQFQSILKSVERFSEKMRVKIHGYSAQKGGRYLPPFCRSVEISPL